MPFKHAMRLSVAALFASTTLAARAADMTWERALGVAKEPQNWLLHHKNYEGHRYSELNSINTGNVAGLRPAFTVAIGGIQGGGIHKTGNLEATPIVEDGWIYLPDGWGSVYAIDATTGKKGPIKWKMDPGTDKGWAGEVACCGVNNRGVALWKDKIVSVTLDARVVLTNKTTGEVVWEHKAGDPAVGETITLAPLVVKDLAIVGSAGGEYGIRGWIEAVDLNTGKRAWRTYTIPGPGEPGHETWKDGRERWKHGGGSVWATGTYDSTTDTLYQGIGNPGPDYDIEYRPGDNKWASSVIALGVADGKIKWGFQYTPNDPYDYDETSEHPLIDAKIDGVDRKLVTHAARNGFFYALDRTNGSFIGGKQYVDRLTWSKGLDPKTGKPLEYDPNKNIQEYQPNSHGSRAQRAGGVTCPSVQGGKNWEPTAYHPKLELLYIPSIEGCGIFETVEQKDFADQGGTVKPRDRFTGGAPKNTDKMYGAIKAVDPRSGDMKASIKLDYPNYSGLLTTAGDLVFAGHYDGSFTAHDAKSLKEVWRFDIGSPVNAPPVTYSVGGRQYISVLVGSRMSAAVIGRAPELKDMSTASMLYVFGL